MEIVDLARGWKRELNGEKKLIDQAIQGLASIVFPLTILDSTILGLCTIVFIVLFSINQTIFTVVGLALCILGYFVVKIIWVSVGLIKKSFIPTMDGKPYGDRSCHLKKFLIERGFSGKESIEFLFSETGALLDRDKPSHWPERYLSILTAAFVSPVAGVLVTEAQGLGSPEAIVEVSVIFAVLLLLGLYAVEALMAGIGESLPYSRSELMQFHADLFSLLLHYDEVVKKEESE